MRPITLKWVQACGKLHMHPFPIYLVVAVDISRHLPAKYPCPRRLGLSLKRPIGKDFNDARCTRQKIYHYPATHTATHPIYPSDLISLLGKQRHQS